MSKKTQLHIVSPALRALTTTLILHMTQCPHCWTWVQNENNKETEQEWKQKIAPKYDFGLMTPLAIRMLDGEHAHKTSTNVSHGYTVLECQYSGQNFWILIEFKWIDRDKGGQTERVYVLVLESGKLFENVNTQPTKPFSNILLMIYLISAWVWSLKTNNRTKNKFNQFGFHFFLSLSHFSTPFRQTKRVYQCNKIIDWAQNRWHTTQNVWDDKAYEICCLDIER